MTALGLLLNRKAGFGAALEPENPTPPLRRDLIGSPWALYASIHFEM